VFFIMMKDRSFERPAGIDLLAEADELEVEPIELISCDPDEKADQMF
jgi:hypothetical protein